jgi:hypothetical protein
MQCQQHKELLERWWNDRLTETERATLERQLMECEDCRRELEGSRELWDIMGYMPVPEPSPDMQSQFNAMLDGYKASAEAKKRRGVGGWASLFGLFVSRPGAAVAFSLVLLLGGVGLGLMLNRPKAVTGAVAGTGTIAGSEVAARPATTGPGTVETKQAEMKPLEPKQAAQSAVAAVAPPKAAPPEGKPESKQLEALTAQVHEMREMMMLSLLQNPAASERIKAVGYTSEIRRVNPNIAAALLATLNNDPNVNVRLTTLEALSHFARDPAVREGLIQSIVQQDSPLLQAALADVMLKLQEKRAIPSLKKLLQQKDLNEMVRTKIEQTITQLT